MRIAGTLILAAALGFGCNKKSEQEAPPPAPVAKAETPKKKLTADDVTKAANEQFKKELAKSGEGTTGRHRPGTDWRPAEYKSGRGRWRDTGAYVDGELVGMFWFGELPRTLEPVWIEQTIGLDFKPGDPPPHEKVVKVRRYRFSDYLEAAGVPVKKIKAIHFYGPHNRILALTGKEFRKHADIFYFRFGLGTEGKPIAVIPKDLGSNFDRLMGVAVYINKKPPKVVDGDAIIDGKPVEGVPYYGEPARGGIRIYKDDRMVSIFKRNKLPRELGTEGDDGTVRWKVLDVLEHQGVKTDDIVEVEVIYDERRTVRFPASELADMTFRSSPQNRGTIDLNDKTHAQSLAFYTKKLPPKTAHQVKETGKPKSFEP
jgi:hypothetical protein